jgi:hypothetical protein
MKKIKRLKLADILESYIPININNLHLIFKHIFAGQEVLVGQADAVLEFHGWLPAEGKDAG